MKEATSSVGQERIKLHCRIHGEYQLSKPQRDKKHICPECHKERLNRPFSAPFSIGALGQKNHFCMINKLPIEVGVHWAYPRKGTPIARLTKWNIVTQVGENEKDKVYALRVFYHRDKIVIKRFGMRVSKHIVMSGKITKDMLVTRKQPFAYKTIFKKYRCCSPCLLSGWADVSESIVGKDVEDYVKKGLVFCM